MRRPETGEFTCGDPMNYHGYDYATVQIGEQCWFAENLRSEFYDNGDGILGDLSDEDWTATSDGAQAIFDDSISNLNVYGRLYNFYAVLDERSLCPAGWHVPEDSSWDTLTESLGGIDYAGLALKSSADDLPSWDGDNSSGFSGLPGGYRDLDGDYVSPSKGRWWSSTVYGCGAWHRDLFPNNDALLLSSYCNPAWGLSQSAASKTPKNEKVTDHIVCRCVGVEPQCADNFYHL